MYPVTLSILSIPVALEDEKARHFPAAVVLYGEFLCKHYSATQHRTDCYVRHATCRSHPADGFTAGIRGAQHRRSPEDFLPQRVAAPGATARQIPLSRSRA